MSRYRSVPVRTTTRGASGKRLLKRAIDVWLRRACRASMASAARPSQLRETRTACPSERSISAQRKAVCRLPLRERAPAGVISAIFMLCLAPLHDALTRKREYALAPASGREAAHAGAHAGSRRSAIVRPQARDRQSRPVGAGTRRLVPGALVPQAARRRIPLGKRARGLR